MKVNVKAFRPARFAMVIAAAGLLPLAAAQAQGAAADLQARYTEEMQHCSTLADPESRRACQREAGAALQEARRNRLATPGDTQANAAARCARLPADRRADCERLMTDPGAVTHGSVSGGGVFRELTITVPAETTTGGTYAPQPAPGYSGQTGVSPGAQPVPAPGYGVPPAAAPYGSVPVR